MLFVVGCVEIVVRVWSHDRLRTVSLNIDLSFALRNVVQPSPNHTLSIVTLVHVLVFHRGRAAKY